jgi:hypothetical protein
VEYLVAIRPSLAGPAAALLETLRQVDPDVVALQEVWGSDETTQATSSRRPWVCLPALLSPLTLRSPTHRSLPTTKA